jgi:tetratricopeptide (TPR) repeat protein
VLQSLVDKSLVRNSDERFWMLETIREFAAERLEESGEAPTTRERHLDYFVELVERAYAERLLSSSAWVRVLAREHDNVRGALDWAQAERPALEARLAGAAAYYWLLRGHAPEARERLSGALERYDSNDQVRGRALTHLGDAIGDMGADAEALPYLEEAVNVWRVIDDRLGEALALESLGYCRVGLGELQEARADFEESLALRRQAGASQIEAGQSLAGLCQVLMASGETERLETAARELHALALQNGSPRIEQSALAYLADRALVSGDYEEAERRYRRALAHARSAGVSVQCPSKVIGVAMSASGLGQPARAVRLAAAAQTELDALGVAPTNPYWQELQDRLIGLARSQLPRGELEEAEQSGKATPFEDVVAEVLAAENARPAR